jgi:hypothetical protein
MKSWKRFCDEEKILRQQRKEGKWEGNSSKTVTSTEESHVEVGPIEPSRKITRQSVAEAINKALPSLVPGLLAA